VVPRSKLLLELARGVYRRIHVTPELPLSAGECVRNGVEWEVTDDEHVDITVGPKLAWGCRSENECDEHTISQGPQGLSQHVPDAGRLEKQCLELWKDRRLVIRSEVDLPALDRSPEETGTG
jgi:hypothetical protein